jgi:hypothetical protein
MEITAIIASLVSVAIIVAVITIRSHKDFNPKKSSSIKQPNDNQVPSC